MKRILLIISCVVCALTLMNSSAYSKKITFPFIGKVKAARVNIRSGPHINFESLGKTKKDQRVTVIGKKQSWYKIRIPNSFSVYINYQFVEKRTQSVGVLKSQKVNVRAKPDLKSPVVGQLNKGEIVVIRGQKNEWLKIIPPDECFAWISKEFVDYLSPVLAEKKKIIPPVIAKSIEKQKAKKKVTMDSGCVPCRAKRKPALPTAKGIVEDSGRLLNKQSLHKLTDNEGKLLYYLDADKKLLDSFSNCRVSVWGKIIKEENYTAPIIKVEKIIIKK